MDKTIQGSLQDFTITVLSTMLVGDPRGIGEWGFAALVEVDHHRMLVDTGARPDTVSKNAQELNVDLSRVHEVVLTHSPGIMLAVFSRFGVSSRNEILTLFPSCMCRQASLIADRRQLARAIR